MQACPKCGYVRQPTDTASAAECPGCGVIYARYLEAQERKLEQAAQKEKLDARAAKRKAISVKLFTWVVLPLMALALVRWGGISGLVVLFLSPLAFYLYKQRNNDALSATGACPSCGGLVAVGVKACPHCGRKKPYPKPASTGAVVLAYLFVGFMIYVLANQQGGGGRLEDGVLANMYCENLVKTRLKAPSSAKFAGYSNSVATPIGARKFRVSSYVDAQNSFGATLRNRYTCVVDFAADTATVESMN